MADAQDSVTTVDEPQDKKKGRFGFGRRKDKDDDTRSETEWVDTLRADEDALPEERPAVSPFAAPETEPEPEHDPSALSALPEAPHEEAHTDDHGSESAAAANGDTEAVYEKSWTRRRHEAMDDIHHYVDNVIGTSLDPARRRRFTSHELGLQNRTTVQREKAASPIRVEGIDEELMVAFTFPPEEFRGARVVYETEGGYVLEVQRALDNDDKRTTHQYYTVSRVGEVAHVLDKMRARDIERDHAALQRTVETERYTTTTRTTTSSTTGRPEPEPVEPLPETTSEPGTGTARRDTTTEALPDSFTEPSGEHASDSAPAVEPVPTPPPRPEPEAAPRPSEAPQVNVADTTAPPAEEAPAEEPGKRGLFGRRKGDSAADETDTEAQEDAPKRGLFGRRKEADDGDDADADGDGDADPDDQESRRRGIFRFKKGSDDEEDA